MKTNGVKHSFRKIAELGIGAVAIGTLILAGCGGGGGGSSSGPASTSLTIVPSLGKFNAGATVRIKDKTGALVASGVVGSNGQATISVPNTAATPLLVEAGVTGDSYYDEAAASSVTISTSGAAVRALVPVFASNSAASQVGVTALTEIATGGLVDGSGVPLAGITPASAVGANAAVGQLFGIANPLTPPALVASASDLTATQDSYAITLAALANMATGSQNALTVAKQISTNLNAASPGTAASTTIAALNTAIQYVGTSSINTAATGIVVTAPAAATTLAALSSGAAATAGAYLASNPTSNITTIISNANNAANAVNTAIAGGASAASAVASVGSSATTAASNSTQIANAKTLLTSLRTNVNLLANSGQTGFIQNQASAVKADLQVTTDSFAEANEFLKFIANGASLIRNGQVTTTPTLTSITLHGQQWPCDTLATSGVGGVVCQWQKLNTAGTSMATHQVKITGAIPTSPSTGTQAESYTWVDTIIGTSNPSTGAITNGLGAVITLGSPTTGTDQYGIVNSPSYPVSPGLTAAGATSATGTFTVSGNLSANGSTGSATVVLNGNTLGSTIPGSTISGYAGSVPLNAAGFAIGDHLQFNNLTGVITGGTTQNTLALSGAITRWSIPTTAHPTGVAISSIGLGTGTQVVDTVGTPSTPFSVTLVLTAASPNYQFTGTISMSSLAQDATTFTTWTTTDGINFTPVTVSAPNWYPQTTSFTGSISAIGASSPFITTTGTGLVLHLNRTPVTPVTNTSYLGFDTSQPTSSTNYQIGSISFAGSIINGSSTYAITGLTASSGNTLTAYSPGGTFGLTYTDPSGNVVGVNVNSGTASGSASLTSSTVTTPVTITASQGAGTVYSGSLSAITAGTAVQIGTISNGFVYFIDNTNQSLK